MRYAMIIALILLPGCSVSEDMIANKDLYCSEVYKGIRAVGRAATELTTGIAIVDVCETIDEVVASDADKSDS
jgi:hypothetical protein